MYLVSKRLEVAYAHHLNLDYTSPCQNLHGHNGIIYIYCMSESLDENGMVVDFKRIKDEIHSFLDHNYINDAIPGMNPTAENMAKWICDNINNWTNSNGLKCYKVTFQESEGNVAAYVDLELATKLKGQGI